MKQIAIYPNGSVGVLDSDSKHIVKIDGAIPVETIDATDENMAIHFPNVDKKKNKITIK